MRALPPKISWGGTEEVKTIPFGKVMRYLEGEVPPMDSPIEERQTVEALSVDALWGSMREEKYRANPLEHGNMEWARKRALARLSKLPEEAPIIRNERPLFPKWGVGWGSYQWRYNPEIPRLAVEYGAMMIDTAETYGFGRVERELGAALRGIPQAFVATKISRAHMSPKAVVKAFYRSTKALGRVPDLYQTHWPSATIPIAETLGALMLEVPELQALGLSNVSVDQIYAAQLVCPTIASVQVKLLMEPWWAKALVPFCEASGLQLIAHSPFSQGRHTDRRCLFFCRDHGVIPIPGTNSPLHLQENLKWS
jgi:diketogulonate reductase-like aldo/keto reductase